MANTCSTNHTAHLPSEFDGLPASQADKWRHKCAGCAYDLGRRHAAEAEERLRTRVRELQGRLKQLQEELTIL